MARIFGTVKRAAVTDSVSPCNNYGRSCGHGWLELEATRAWKKRPYYSLTLHYDICSVNNQGRVIRRRTSVHSSSRRRPSPAAAAAAGTEHEGYCGQLFTEYGWEVGRLSEVKKSHQMLQRVALVQAQAFHVPMPLFNDSFFYFFQAEVLSGLLYKLRNSPPDRYACLVAMPSTEESSSDQSRQELIVGVVDATVLSDRSVLQHLQGAPEYMYVSGIAVLDTHRRRKVATALLKACDVLCVEWGLEYSVLRAYEDDMGARRLYANAGYRVVSKDPIWLTTLIGRKRRVLMVKRSTPLVNDSHLART